MPLASDSGLLDEQSSESDKRVETVRPVVRWAFYAFVASIMYESMNIGVPLEVTTVTGFLLVLSTLSQPSLFFRVPPAAVWAFVVYIYLSVMIIILVAPGDMGTALQRQVVLAQSVLFFWIASQLMRHESIARRALLSLILACSLAALLNQFGLTSTTAEAASRSGRLSIFGLEPNQLAGVMSLSLLALLGLSLGQKRSLIQPRYVAWILFALVGVTVIQTGSRGGLLSLIVGLSVLLMNRGSVAERFRNLFLLILGAGFIAWAAWQSPAVRARFERTVQTGDMTARERIFPAAVAMFRERPWIGWGPYSNTVELQNRVRVPGYSRMTAHNLLLYLLTATGIVGTIPFLCGLALCLRSAWRARHGAHGILPLAMAISVLVASMSVDGLHWKQFWFVMAYALASQALVASSSTSRPSDQSPAWSPWIS